MTTCSVFIKQLYTCISSGLFFFYLFIFKGTYCHWGLRPLKIKLVNTAPKKNVCGLEYEWVYIASKGIKFLRQGQSVALIMWTLYKMKSVVFFSICEITRVSYPWRLNDLSMKQNHHSWPLNKPNWHILRSGALTMSGYCSAWIFITPGNAYLD